MKNTRESYCGPFLTTSLIHYDFPRILIQGIINPSNLGVNMIL